MPDASSPGAARPAGPRTLHIISQAHLDPVWLWPWRDGCAEALTTMQSALDRMRETPQFRFSQSAAATYRWAQQMDPRLFDEIRGRVAEGRWEIVGGWIVQPDCNLPSTESFVRQCLYGKRYFAEQFGVDVAIGYNVDSFGHGGGLPQVLARAGYGYYVMMRPQAHEQELPPLFWWESDDGSRVLTWRIPTSYGQGPRTTPDQLEAMLRATADRCLPPGFDDGAFFLGVGNHGGGPSRQHVERILALQRAGDPDLPLLRFSTLAEFFAAVEASPAFGRIPVVRGELQHHARGCYAAMGEIKAFNRRAERSLGKAEALSALAGPGSGCADATIEDAWWQVLFNQFHDVLAGTSIRSAYRDARDSLGAACDAADGTSVRALQSLARRVNTSGAPGGVLFAFNHLPWARTAVVEVDTFVAPQGEPITHLRDEREGSVPIQWTASEHSQLLKHWRRLTAAVPLPACGYRVFHLATGDGADGGERPAECSLSDAAPGIGALPGGDDRLLSGPVGMVVLDDPSDTWAHGVEAFTREAGRPALESASVLEDGPVVRVARQEGRWRNSRIILDVATWRHTPAVELRLRVNWQERRQVLKLEVPTALTDVRVFSKVPGGVAERRADGGEEPCQDWLALQGVLRGETWSLGVVNDSTYGYDCRDGRLRLTCLRSAPYAEHDPVKAPDGDAEPYLDQGWQERRFWLVAAPGDYQDLNLPRLAEELQSPAERVMDSAHPGTEPWEQSFLSLEPDAVCLLAAKRSEDGRALVLRLQETAGRPESVRLRLPTAGLEWNGPIGPWQIKTLMIQDRDPRSASEVDLIERPLAGR